MLRRSPRPRDRETLPGQIPFTRDPWSLFDRTAQAGNAMGDGKISRQHALATSSVAVDLANLHQYAQAEAAPEQHDDSGD